MRKYIAYNAIDSEYEEFQTIEEARKYLEEVFIDDVDKLYHPDMEGCKIFELKEVVSYDVVDRKENYKYLNEEDIPDDDDESEAWPYDNAADEIWKHKFVPISAVNEPENIPDIDDYPQTDSRTYKNLDGTVNWKKYAMALRSYILNEPEKPTDEACEHKRIRENIGGGRFDECLDCGKTWG